MYRHLGGKSHQIKSLGFMQLTMGKLYSFARIMRPRQDVLRFKHSMGYRGGRSYRECFYQAMWR